jgi:dTMP kinase
MPSIPQRPGFFLTFEGGEGSGKSTQMHALARFLQDTGYPLIVTREPGGTGIGDDIRRIVLDRTNFGGMSNRTELLLYQASRAQLVDQIIRPALEHGAVVICDRFSDSTTAYQGYGRGLDLTLIRQLTLAATGGLRPHCTILLDITPAIGLARTRARTGPNLDRLERETLAFHERVRQGYLLTAQEEPDRFVILHATGDPESIQSQLRTLVCDRLQAHGMRPEPAPAGSRR